MPEAKAALALYITLPRAKLKKSLPVANKMQALTSALPIAINVTRRPHLFKIIPQGTSVSVVVI